MKLKTFSTIQFIFLLTFLAIATAIYNLMMYKQYLKNPVEPAFCRVMRQNNLRGDFLDYRCKGGLWTTKQNQ